MCFYELILLNGKEVEQFNGQAEINISNAEIIERTMITWGKLDNPLTIDEFNKLKNTKAILKIVQKDFEMTCN